MGKEPYLRGMWEHFSCERSKAKKFRQLADEDAAKEKQAGIQGQWQQESPAREYLEQVKCCQDCNESMMKKGFTAVKNGTWEEYQETFKEKLKASEWAFDRIKEAFDLEAKDEVGKISILQEIVLTDYLRRIIASVGGQGGVTMSSLCPYCNGFPLEDYVWGVYAGKTTKWCAICRQMYDWKQQNRLLVVQTGDRIEQAKVLKKSTCDTAGLVRKLDQCVEVLGESS